MGKRLYGRMLHAIVALASAAALAIAAPASAIAWEGGDLGAAHPQADSIASGTWGTCPWEISEDGTLTVHPGRGENAGESSPWDEDCSVITRVVMSKEGASKVVAPSNCAHLFDSLHKAESIDLSGLDASSVTDVGGMFYHCQSLERIDFSGLDTSSVTNMSEMFYDCDSLGTIDFSGLDTSSATNMHRMFYGCGSLGTIDLAGLDTCNVTDMGGMFESCPLTSIDLTPLDTSKVTDMSSMFQGCDLTSIDLTPLDTSKVTDMNDMFCGCELTSIDLTPLDTSKVTEMFWMFKGCPLTSIDLSVLDTSSVTDMYGMFEACTSLKSAKLSGLDTSSLTDTQYMFFYCPSLTFLDLSGLDTSKVTLMTGMFNGCASLTSLDVSGFDTSGVTEMETMFAGCPSLKTIYVGPSFSTAKVTNSKNMFKGSTSLVGGNGTAFDEKRVDAEYARVDAPGSPGYFTFKASGPGATDVSRAQVAVAAQVYSGAPLEPPVAVTLGGRALVAGADYSLTYSSNMNAGTAAVTVTGKGKYKGSKAATFEIAPAPNSAAVSKTTVKKTLKAKKLRKKVAAVALPKVSASFGDARWQVVKRDKKKALTLKGGKVKVKKKARKGKYTIKLKATVAGTLNYAAASTKVVTVKVKVK